MCAYSYVHTHHDTGLDKFKIHLWVLPVEIRKRDLLKLRISSELTLTIYTPSVVNREKCSNNWFICFKYLTYWDDSFSTGLCFFSLAAKTDLEWTLHSWRGDQDEMTSTHAAAALLSKKKTTAQSVLAQISVKCTTANSENFKFVCMHELALIKYMTPLKSYSMSIMEGRVWFVVHSKYT